MKGVKSPELVSARVRGSPPRSRMPETISALARAMFSRLPSRPMWLVPTLVIAASAGWHAAARRSISWAWFMPSSQTTTSASSGVESTVRGPPMRLLRLPRVAWQRRWEPKPAASISLVVVLPTDPVTATTSQPGCSSRQARARRSRNSSQSSPAARRTAQPAARAASRSFSATAEEATTAAAPAEAAEAR